MKVFINGEEYQGTPEEIAEFLRLTDQVLEPSDVESDIESEPTFPIEDFEPMEEVISKSETLRRKLADNPNYSEAIGVSSSKEPDINASTVVTAEQDTGVDLK